MKMSNYRNPHHLTASLLVIVALVQILAFASPAVPSCTNKGLEVEEKAILGSMPPSCHSKCNECHPCFAVQVPTLPSHDRLLQLQPTATATATAKGPGNTNSYSNYKPLGWKCRCNNHFYNP